MSGSSAGIPAKFAALAALAVVFCWDALSGGAAAEHLRASQRRSRPLRALLPDLASPSFVLSASQVTPQEEASSTSAGESAEGAAPEKTATLPSDEKTGQEKTTAEEGSPVAEKAEEPAASSGSSAEQQRSAADQILAENILRVSEALSRQQAHVVPPSAGVEGAQQKEPSALEQLRSAERRCKTARQAIVVIDGGSTKTRAQLFSVLTESCPFKGRRVLRDSISFLEEGKSFTGLRTVLEEWLDAHAGDDWASKAFQAEALLSSYDSMQRTAKELVEGILKDAAGRLEKHFSEAERLQAQSLGVPVFFHSTAGVRGFHDWYCEGLLTAAREAVNACQGFKGFLFFTNERMTRAISGEEEGINAFLTANHKLGNFSRLLEEANKGANGGLREPNEEQRALQQNLLGIVEVGGASMQIVFPVSALASHPSFVRVRNLQRSGYLTADYPRVEVLAVSFMQLGASSASGVFLKAFCGDPKNRRDSICLNPCLPKGFKQKCSTGDVEIEADGSVRVASERNKQKVKPVATYCSGSNREISEKALNRLSCVASRINPDLPLDERLQIEGCSDMEGTGDFEACSAAVDALLMDPPVPLPANQEASSAGFDAPAQIFKFISSPAPLYVTGMALVAPVKKLQELGLLSPNFSGDVEELRSAAQVYCRQPLETSESGGLAQRFQVQGEAREAPVDKLSYDNCMRLAMAERLLHQMQGGAFKPSHVFFEHTMIHPDTKAELGEFGWHVGTILKNVIREREWARDAYELGVVHTLEERTAAQQIPPPVEAPAENQK